MKLKHWAVVIVACYIVGAIIVVLDAWAIGRASSR